jgi:hypothetical protein
MDNKTFGIGILSLTALILFIAQFIPVRSNSAAFGSETISGRDYQLVTARIAQGGEALYVVDNKSGLGAVFSWDPNSRSVALRAVRPVADAFGQ